MFDDVTSPSPLTIHNIPVSKELSSLIKGDHTWRLDINKRINVLIDTVTKYSEHFINAGFDIKYLMNLIQSLSKFNFELNQSEFCYLHGDLYQFPD